MQIDIPPDEAEKLARYAMAAGFDSVERYVTEFVLTLAESSSVEELFPTLTDDEMAASLAMVDLGREQINRGEGISVDEARQRSLDKLDYV